MDDFITVLLNDRQEHESVNLCNEELQEWENKRQSSKEELHILLGKHLPEECNARCDHLIAELEEIDLNIHEFKKRIYFEMGVKEGAKIAHTLKL